MKQFSLRTVEIWESQFVGGEEERLISEYIQFETVTASKENSQGQNNLAKDTDTAGSWGKNGSGVLTPKSSSKKVIYGQNE